MPVGSHYCLSTYNRSCVGSIQYMLFEWVCEESGIREGQWQQTLFSTGPYVKRTWKQSPGALWGFTDVDMQHAVDHSLQQITFCLTIYPTESILSSKIWFCPLDISGFENFLWRRKVSHGPSPALFQVHFNLILEYVCHIIFQLIYEVSILPSFILASLYIGVNVLCAHTEALLCMEAEAIQACGIWIPKMHAFWCEVGSTHSVVHALTFIKSCKHGYFSQIFSFPKIDS